LPPIPVLSRPLVVAAGMMCRHVYSFYPNHPESLITLARCEIIVSIVSIVSTAGYVWPLVPRPD
jgi:hypothetical protein